MPSHRFMVEDLLVNVLYSPDVLIVCIILTTAYILLITLALVALAALYSKTSHLTETKKLQVETLDTFKY